MKKYKFIAQIAAISSIPYFSYAVCHSRIINNSNKPWTVEFSTVDGNVYFKNIDDNQCKTSKIKHDHPQNGPCTIYPNQDIEIDYTTSIGATDGLIGITDYTGQAGFISYGNNGFNSSCPHISLRPGTYTHITTSVIFNTPKRGDIQMKLESWADGNCEPG